MLVTIRDAIQGHTGAWLACAGLVIGCVAGITAARTNFCTLGAVSDALLLRDFRRLRSWMLAIAVAMAGTQGLAASGLLALDASFYLASPINWLGAAGGGVLFGTGMALAGGCGFRNLVRAGTGDLGAATVLAVLGVSAWAAATGPLEPMRAAIQQATAISLAAPSQGLDRIAWAHAGGQPEIWRSAVAGGVVGCLLLATLGHAGFRSYRPGLLAGAVVGLMVFLGWFVTGLAYDELALAPRLPNSLSFVRPVADALGWMTGFDGLPGFGVATVLGTLLGSAVAAGRDGRFRLQTFAGLADVARSGAGALLMGIGGIAAGGCTIGQGITGVATLGAGSVLALGGMLAGTVAGLKALEAFLSD